MRQLTDGSPDIRTHFEAAWTTYDDVGAALAMVASRTSSPVGIVTNFGADHQRRKLEIVGLGGFFDVVVGLDTLGFGKPDPRVFRHACELLGTQTAATPSSSATASTTTRSVRATPVCGRSGSTGRAHRCAPMSPTASRGWRSLAELEAVLG